MKEGELGGSYAHGGLGLWATEGLVLEFESSCAKVHLASSWCTRPGDCCMFSHDPSSGLVPLCHAKGTSVSRRDEEHLWWLWCL